jgi:ABC-2 type transport system permease protein
VVALGRTLHLFGVLVGASLRSQMQYRASFLIRSGVDFLAIVSDFAPIFFLVERFGALQGWSFAELALLYGMVATSWGVIEGALFGFENFAAYLIEGRVDRWLLRPRSVILQVSTFQFEVRKIGRILQGVTVLGVAAWFLGLDAAALGWVAMGVLGGMLFFAGVVMLGAASQFWTLGNTSELQNMLTYGGSAALSYPVSVYSQWFRRIVTYAIPLAFVNYFPAIAALGRTAEAGWPAWLPWLSPFACLAVLGLGVGAFRLGLRRYESSGT